MSWDICFSYLSHAPGSWSFGLGLTALAHMVLRPLGLDWNYITSFFGLSAYRWQIIGLHSLQNCVSQFLIINLFLYIYIYPIGSVSLENPD